MNDLLTIFKLLSDETRLRLIMLLYQEELCVCELCGVLDLPQPKVSNSLSKLRDLNLVLDQRKEKFVFYTLTSDHLVLTTLIHTLLEELDTYPQLKLDRQRLKDKASYLDQCSLDGLNKIS